MTALAMPTHHAPGTTDDEAWALVSTRDRSADGRFVYAVRTTGVYCRPSCPSRRPRRANVAFFDDPAAAERAGFRACLRCRPASTEPDLVTRARTLLERDEAVPTLNELAAALGVSEGHLQRRFQAAMGLSPRAYAERLRSERLRRALHEGATVTRAIFDAGFGSASQAYATATRHLGMTPGAYRRGGAGLRIEYALTDSSLGRLLVAWTPRGVCAVYPGADDGALEAALAREFPNASRTRAPVSPHVRKVLAALDGDETLPALDPQGTAFQQQVWRTLTEIPRGTTRSYTEVARRLGRPDAVRAVAGACAANNIAVLIPCHRVLRGDGGLGGYRWGEDRKRRLLASERR